MKAPARIRLVSRRLLRAPLFSLVAVATLGLGIGANTAIFSVIRGALGAVSRDVTGLFLRQGLLLAGTGIVLGLAAAGVATRVMTTLLYGVRPLDPLTYAAVAGGLGVTALLASYLPAARAARVAPAEALRREV